MTQDITFQPTEEQAKIIALSEGRHLVLAPPGTGKTEMLSYRVLHALNRGIPPEKMLCLTFTVRAAMEMKERIRKVVPHSELPELGNVHHFCHHFLFSKKLLPQKLQVIDEDMQSDLMLEVAEEFPSEQMNTIRDKKKDGYGPIPVQKLLKAAASLRQFKFNFPVEIVEPLVKSEVYERNPGLVERIAVRYHEQKEFLSVIDYDDLLTHTYYFLAFKSVLKPEDLCVWVQVDEVQDLSPLQMAIIDKLSIPTAHVTYFGDMEQSIFSFMGASAENLNRVAKHCVTHNLIKNFRSKSYLLDLFIRYAIKTLRVNWDYLPLPGATVARNSNDLQIVDVPAGYRFDDKSENQSAYIANLLKSELLKHELEQTAILVSTNKIADAATYALEGIGCGKEVYKVSGFDLFSRIEFRDFKAYCAIFHDSTDRIAWSRLFKLFAKLRTQKEARIAIKALFDAGFVPSDFMDETYGLLTLTYLEEFRRCILRERVVVFDTETTGLNRQEDEIIQIAAVEYVAGVRGQTFEVYINTPHELGDSEDIHKISREMLVAQGVSSREGLSAFSDFISDSVLVAHNLAFDIAMVKAGFARHGVSHDILQNPMFDTLDLSRRVYADLNSFKLVDLIESLHLVGCNTHNAMDDVMVTGELMMHLVENSSSVIGKQADAIRKYERVIYRFRESFSPLWQRIKRSDESISTYRAEFTEFIGYCFAQGLYSYNDLLSSEDGQVADPKEFVLERAEKFMRYTDFAYSEISAKQPFLAVLDNTQREIRRFKEVDVLVGDEHIVISTIHKAKGLQFDRVIIMRCEDDVFPNFFCRTPEQISESARLLYVGMTRAKRRLTLLYSGSCSRFLEPVIDCFQQDTDIFRNGAGPISRFFKHPDWLTRFQYLIRCKQKKTRPQEIDEFLKDPDKNVRLLAQQLHEDHAPLP